jgi:signal peptidase
VLYLTLYFVSGLKYGFVISGGGRITLSSFLRYVLPISVIIVSTEKIREIMLAGSPRVLVLISYAVGVASELACKGGIPSIRNVYQVAALFGLVVFPALTANILFTYLTKRYGMASAISYRMIMTLYVYFIPASTDAPRALVAFILMLLPLIIYLFVDALFEKRVRYALKRNKSVIARVLACLVLVLMLCFILLITCQFRFGMVMIATDSMTGTINRSDAVIYEKYDSSDTPVTEGDIIIFMENNRRVVHRIVEINNVNGQRQYITKGDANETNDPGFRTDSDIVGVVRLRVRFLGYPSLVLHELTNN